MNWLERPKFWIKINDPHLNNYMRILSKKRHYQDDEGYELEYNPAFNRLTLIGSGDDLASINTINLDTNWHPVAGTISTAIPIRKSPSVDNGWSKGKNAKLYLDGEAVLTNGKVSPLKAGHTDVSIGQISSGGAFFDGLIDELQLYKRTLNPAEIKNIFQAGSKGVCK